MDCLYGDLVFTGSGIVAQALGMRAGEYCVVMPKYIVCNDDTPWEAGWGRLCRIIRGYGPRGLARAVRASGLQEKYHPALGSPVPVVSASDIVFYRGARDALEYAVSSGDPGVVGALSVLAGHGVRLSSLGLTGSRAGGYAHARSDVDLVVYDADMAEEFVTIFRGFGGPWDPAGKSDLGGVWVSRILDLSWRRRVVRTRLGEFGITWIGAPPEPLGHCPPLRSLPGPPEVFRQARLCIEPGQWSALLYPPCARSREGTWIVSYEYNLAELLYRGGCMKLAGLSSRDGSIVYLGTREFPGRIWVD